MLKKMILILLCALMLGGCSKDKNNIEITADPFLLTFMPETLNGYSGEGGYYHESNRIESVIALDGNWFHVFGEVKDNLAGYSKIDFNYQINYLVDAIKIVQTYEGIALNESQFTSIELLKLPVEKGNTWVFSTEDDTGKNVKVTGQIIEVSEDGSHVVVKHSTKDGYYEQRDVVQGLGVTDFIRQVTYKDESILSGYHIEREPMVSEIENEMAFEGIEISDAYYQLILNFEESWTRYVRDEDEKIFETVLSQSNAEQKIKSIAKMPTFDLEFVQIIPYEQLVVGDVQIIYVKEQFVNASEELTENKMMFTIIEEASQLKIIDFEAIK